MSFLVYYYCCCFCLMLNMILIVLYMYGVIVVFGCRLKKIAFVVPYVLYASQTVAVICICSYSTIGKYHHNTRSMIILFLTLLSVVVLLFLLVLFFIMHLFYWLFFIASFIIRHHILDCVLPGFTRTTTQETGVAVFDYRELFFNILHVL